MNNWGEIRKVFAADAHYDYFGGAVALSGDTLVGGAPLDDDEDTDAGGAHVFLRNEGGSDNWGEIAELIHTPYDGEEFGFVVAADGDTVVVGDNQSYSDGTVFIFYRNEGGANNWGEVELLRPIAFGYGYGRSVALSGDTLAIGMRAGPEVYLHERNEGGADNWGRVKIVEMPDISVNSFGYSVSLDNDTLLIGAIGDDDNGLYSGSALVYERNEGGADNWGEVAKLLPSDGDVWDLFGEAVAVKGDTAVVGASQNDDNGERSGSAYVFERNLGGANNWGEARKLLPSSGSADAHFGYSVTIDGDRVVVGAYRHTGTFYEEGAAYLFERNQGGRRTGGSSESSILRASCWGFGSGIRCRSKETRWPSVRPRVRRTESTAERSTCLSATRAG